MSLDVVKSRHNKELKALEGERRAELKKAKGTAGKGQKAKEILTALEAKYEERLTALKAKHVDEILALEGEVTSAAANESVKGTDTEEQTSVHQDQERKAKAEKARRKREKAREKELQREREIQAEIANAGPSQKEIEMDMLMEKLAPLNMTIEDVVADGHCLYRAVGKACGQDYIEIRRLCADTLKQNEDDFAPFCDYNDAVTNFEQYTERVRNSADWGGHLELRALSIALERPMIIYQAGSTDPLQIDSALNSGDPIRLSYHKHYYSLGEHYNLVVPLC